MIWKQLFARKSLEMLQEEARGDNRLKRVLGPVALTSLGVGAIIGAGIFVMTGRAAANDAGPAVLLSYTVAGLGCALAAFCYAEFASMAPVAGSAYTYAYATLGELFAWIIGWDLVLEYAMSCATVAASWSQYLNKFLETTIGWKVPEFLCSDPFSQPGAWFNLPAVIILAAVTIILVIGIRESATSNTALVIVKLGVVLFVIIVGVSFIDPANWTSIPVEERKLPEQLLITDIANEAAKKEEVLILAAKDWSKFRFDKEAEKVIVQMEKDASGSIDIPKDFDAEKFTEKVRKQALATYILQRAKIIHELQSKKDPAKAAERLEAVHKEWDKYLPKTQAEIARTSLIVDQANKDAPAQAAKKWGLLGYLGINDSLISIDDSVRTPFMPYGLSGLMLGASIVFFAFIGFDSISTHAEEARNPQRDVPIGIIASLVLCTVLYIGVSAVITGMVPYPKIDVETAVADAFHQESQKPGGSPVLKASSALIAGGALAGMTSVLLITFLSQARIFLAMARDQLLPHAIFGVVHPRFQTPHVSTMLTGGIICVVAAFTPILILEEMVNIGTLFAFVVVCAAVLILRIRRPEAHRPFRCPLVYVLAPLGIIVNLIMMLFLPLETWIRLVVWLVIGLFIYFGFSYGHSLLGETLRKNEPPSEGNLASAEAEP